MPSAFRERFGAEIVDYLATRSAEVRERRGVVGVVGFWVRGVADLVRVAIAERREARVESRRGGVPMRRPLDLGADVRFGMRALRRSPGFTLAALATLALGIGATTAMFSVVNEALRRSLPYPGADRLVMGRATFQGNVNPWVSFPDYMDYRDQARSLSSLATIGGGSSLVTVTGTGEAEQARLTFVTRNLFATLGVRPALGTTFSIDELPETGGGEVVISHGFWQRRFGGAADVVGRTIIVDGESALVTGVMPAGFRFLYDVDMWVPPWPGNSDPLTRRYHNWLLVGRLAPGATLATAQSEADVISTQLEETYPDSNRDKALQLDDLHAALVEGYRQSLLLLVGAIVLVLLIACGNVASLLLARGSTRTSEMSVRTALGAGRLRLVRQLLAECVVLAVAAGAAGVVIAVWLQKLILGFVSMDLLGVQEGGLSISMLSFALVLSVTTVLLFGVFPSVVVARANPAQDLTEGRRGTAKGGGLRFRGALVVLQVAVSLVLLVGAGLLLRSFAKLRGVDPGFRVENLLTATVSLPSGGYDDAEQRIRFFEDLKEEIEALPGVESVGLVSRLPILQPAGNVAIWAPERPPETNNQTPWADRRIVLPGYFATMRIPLLRGRLPDETDVAGSAPVIVLSRRTADAIFPDSLYPGVEVVGRQVAVDVGETEPGLFDVIGIVEDHQNSSLSGRVRPAMFFPFTQMPTSTMRLAVAARADPLALIRPIQERIWDQNRDIVLSDARTMEDAVSASISGTRAVSTVLGLFAIAAAALAALGLYGVLAYSVARRTQEIGIRVALGATGGNVLRMVVVRGMTLVGLGVALGIAGALGATRLVRDMLFQTSATDASTFTGVTALFLLVALGACLLPAWRALRVDPVAAFRTE
jgi:predicted permease